MSFSVSVNYDFLLDHSYDENSLLTDSGELNTTTSVESTNINVTVYPHWYLHSLVEWKIPDDWGNCKFNVYAGQTQDGSFTKLTSSPIDNYALSDNTNHDFRKLNNNWYIVEAILLDRGGKAVRSLPTTVRVVQSDWVALRATEIQRRAYLLLSRFNGVQSYVFKKRYYGLRCPECWNYKANTTTKDRCHTCLGTGFDKGYFDAKPLFINYGTTPNDVEKSYSGLLQPNQIDAWTISFPEIRADDIIVRTGDWAMYIVDRVQNTELQTNPVRQSLLLNQLSRADIEYELLSRGLPEFTTSQYNGVVV